jgi:hypothetical protein
MMWGRRSRKHAGRARGAPPAAAWSGGIARIGAPPLIALGCALGLLALLICALFVPGFVRPADAETTTSTEAAPAESSPERPSTTDTLPAMPAPAEPSPGRQLVTLPWGHEAGEVGLVQPAEGLTRGPEALAVAPDGRIAILDSVNARVVVLAADGSFSGALPVSLSQPRFLAVDNGSIYVLDADTDRQLICLDWQGAQVHAAQIPVFDDVVTGLFATDDAPCIEVAHDQVFAVEFKDNGKQAAGSGALATGVAARADRPAACSLHAIAGRPLDRDLGKAARIAFKPKDGVKLKRFRVDKKSFKGAQTGSAAPAFGPGKAIEHLVSVDGDGSGGLIIGARLLRSKSDPSDAPSLIVGRLAAGADRSNAAPRMTDTLTLSDSPFAYLGQPYVVGPDGRIFQPVGTDAGYTIMVYSLPGAPALPASTASSSGPAVAAAGEVQP